MSSSWPVKFVPFSSSVSSPFWVAYSREKLEKIKLSEEPIDVFASYTTVADGGPPRLQLNESSLDTSGSNFSNDKVLMKGKLFGFNTLEAFQQTDKNELLKTFFCQSFIHGDMDILTSFVLLTYPDLKNHKIIYWFGIPALFAGPGMSVVVNRQQSLNEQQLGASDDGTEPSIFIDRAELVSQIDGMRKEYTKQGNIGLPPFFLRTNSQCVPLSKESYDLMQHDKSLIFGFFDPAGPNANISDKEPFGWPMRNLITWITFNTDSNGEDIRILSYRPSRLAALSLDDEIVDVADTDCGSSILVTITLPHRHDYLWESRDHRVGGWELNQRGKNGPRMVDLRPLLDSEHLAVQAADLNLKLMKWRMIPDLNVEKIQSTRVLLIGAGTLGCNVARTLLGWGVRNFKFIDYGKVSYSNPVRQPLFKLDDCQAEGGSGRPKAEAAAQALTEIAADVQSEGISMSIPMPGHTEKPEVVAKTVQELDSLISESDVIFLLTDTRESRWLPTVIAAAHDKLLINAALGLDSWLVIRHGGDTTNGDRHGCYFCNDVVAPENSTRNRTLDQQCTVSRPGLAPIASAMAAEVMIALLHHPDYLNAPAPIQSGTFSTGAQSDSPLGVIPHQIRGSLVSYSLMTPAVPAFSCCTGCSPKVIDAYRRDPTDLVTKTCTSPDGAYLENISGLTAFRADAAEKMDNLDGWDEDDM